MPRSSHHWRKKVPFVILFIIGLGGLLSFAVMWLWNQVLVPVTGIREVDFWQALGLLILCRILFGGFRGGPWKRGPGSGSRHSKWREKWQSMSEEDRQELKKRWKEKCN